MSFPAGVETVTLSFGSGLFLGTGDVNATLTVKPVFTGAPALLWSATGELFLPFPLTAEAKSGAEASVTVPRVDQAGWNDSAGNAYTNWYYAITIRYQVGNDSIVVEKMVQPLAVNVGTPIDLERLVFGSPADPQLILAMVKTVNGTSPDASGNVIVATGITQAAGDLRYAMIGRAISAGTGLTGGGTLASDKTIALNAASIASLAAADAAVPKTAAAVGSAFFRDVNGNPGGVPIVSTAATAGSLVQRQSDGTIFVGTPTVGGNAATKDYVDTNTVLKSAAGNQQVFFKNPAGAIGGLDISTAASASVVVQRQSNGHIIVPGTPSANTDAASKSYVDGVGATKADLVGGFVPTSQLPALAINDVFTVASQAAMLALTAQRGDMAIRSDTNRTYILAADAPATLANWVILPDANSIVSVNGQQGIVVLAAADVGAVPTTRSVNGKPLSSDVTLTAADVSAVPTTGVGNGSVFVKNGVGTLQGLAYGTSNTASTMALRDAAGNIAVATTPVNTTDAASKQYADERAGDQAPVTANATATGTIDLTAAASGPAAYRFSLTGNVVLTIPTPSINVRSWTVTLRLSQDGTGGRTVSWPSYIKWAGGVKPTLSTAAAAVDVVNLYWDGVNWYGFLAGVAFA